MNLMVTGAAGKLGWCLCRHFSRSDDVHGFSREDLDISVRESVFGAVHKIRPNIILNAAAFTAVDRCEDEPERAYRVNAEGPRCLAEAARETGARLVHFSTDFVFDGNRLGPPYTEADEVNPLSVYGKSKLEGEQAVLETCPEHLVLRLSWVYGRGGWNFVDWVVGEVEKGTEVRIVTDQWGTPTWVGDVAIQVESLLDAGTSGLYHCAGKGVCSRFEWACRSVELAGLEPGKQIIPITSDEFPQKAPRPRYSALDNKRLREEGLETMRPWEEALADHLAGRERPNSSMDSSGGRS